MAGSRRCVMFVLMKTRVRSVQIPVELDNTLRSEAEAVGISVSALVRQAIERGLPIVLAGRAAERRAVQREAAAGEWRDHVREICG